MLYLVMADIEHKALSTSIPGVAITFRTYKVMFKLGAPDILGVVA